MSPYTECLVCVHVTGSNSILSGSHDQKYVAKETEAMGKLFYISRDTHHNIEACCDAEGA